MRATTVLPICAILAAACDSRPGDLGPPRDPQAISLRVEGPSQLTPPAEARFMAVEMWSDGSTRDVTASAQWTSSNPSVLSISGGVGRALTGGEVGLTVQFGRFTSQPKSVRVIPSIPEWTGTYTLTMGGGPCADTSAPLPPELTRRSYRATLTQNGLTLTGLVFNVGVFAGQIVNPAVRFALPNFEFLRRAKMAPVTHTVPLSRLPATVSLVATDEPRVRLAGSRRVSYPGGPRGFYETIPAGRLVFTGEAVTTMTPSGFTGTLDGAVLLYAPSSDNRIGICSSTSHVFTLVRN
jgi:hypothetical protein